MMDCAIRELQEETNLRLTKDDLSRSTQFEVKSNLFFCLEVSSPEEFLPPYQIHEEISGYTWINVHCLLDLIKAKKMDVSMPCKVFLNRYFSIDLWKTVGPTVCTTQDICKRCQLFHDQYETLDEYKQRIKERAIQRSRHPPTRHQYRK
jgi:hypothetical protein